MANPINIAIIGCGNIGQKHLRIASEQSFINLKAVADTVSKNIPENIPYYNNIDKLLEGSTPLDLVSICTPSGMHYEQAKIVLSQGINVLVEKPVTLKTENFKSLHNIAIKNGCKIYCMLQNRYAPISQWLKNIISDGRLGNIYSVNVQCYWNRDERYYSDQKKSWRGTQKLDGGSLFTQFSHFVDLLYWLFGGFNINAAQFANFNHQNSIEFEDTGHFHFSFDQGAIGSFSYTTSTWDKNFETNLTILAQNGTIKVGGQYMDQLHYCHVKNYEPPQIDQNSNESNMTIVYADIYNDIRSGQPNISSQLNDGYKVIEIIEQIYEFRK